MVLLDVFASFIPTSVEGGTVNVKDNVFFSFKFQLSIAGI